MRLAPPANTASSPLGCQAESSLSERLRVVERFAPLGKPGPCRLGQSDRAAGICRRAIARVLPATASLASVSATASARALSLIHISEPTRLLSISYAVFC